jgi:hypothetical protein
MNPNAMKRCAALQGKGYFLSIGLTAYFTDRNRRH